MNDYREEELDELRKEIRDIVGEEYYKYLQLNDWLGRIVILKWEYIKKYIGYNMRPYYSCEVFNSNLEELPLLMNKKIKNEIYSKCYRAVIGWRMRLGK